MLSPSNFESALPVLRVHGLMCISAGAQLPARTPNYSSSPQCIASAQASRVSQLLALQGMGAVDNSLDKSHITMEELDARAQPAAGPRLPPRSAPKGSQGKRKGKR